MKWKELLDLIGAEPLFTSALLRVGRVPDGKLRLQLSRWTKAGRILQLRRGVYLLAPPYRRIEPHPFLISNHLARASYVSLESALAYHGLIPEYVPVVTSVTTKRPERLQTPVGTFIFRHIKQSCLFGYRQVEVSSGQHAFVATPEKALLDLIYLTPGGHETAYLRELRLQNLEVVDEQCLLEYAARFNKAKMRHAAERLIGVVEEEAYDEP